MAAVNPLRKIWENNSRISELQKEITELSTENDKCMSYAISKGWFKRGGFTLEKKQKVGRSVRVPVMEKVLTKIGANVALAIAKFEKGSLAGLQLPDEVINTVITHASFGVTDLEGLILPGVMRKLTKEEVDSLCEVSPGKITEEFVLVKDE